MTEAADKMVAEAARSVWHDKVHAEARERHLNDATMSGYDHHVVIVAAEHGARAALQSSRPVGGEAEPVAVIGKNWSLLWATQGSLTQIVERTGIGIGSKLYTHPAPSPVSADVVEKLVRALEDLLRRDQGNTCLHEDTHRGGAIWEICDACGMKWADDEGGKPTDAEPAEWAIAELALTAISSLPEQDRRHAGQ